MENDRDKLLNSANRITDLLKMEDIDTNKAKSYFSLYREKLSFPASYG